MMKDPLSELMELFARRDMWKFLLAYGAVGLLAFAPMLTGADWTAVVAPYRFQLSRPTEFGLIIYGKVLPTEAGVGLPGTLTRMSILGVTMALLFAFPIRDMHSLLRRCAIMLLVFVSLAVFYSPQWILWLGGLIAPLLGRNPRLAYTTILFDAITYLTFPVWFFTLGPLVVAVFGNFDGFDRFYWYVLQVLLYARFICSGVFILQLVWLDWQARRPAEPPPVPQPEATPPPDAFALKPAT